MYEYMYIIIIFKFYLELYYGIFQGMHCQGKNDRLLKTGCKQHCWGNTFTGTFPPPPSSHFWHPCLTILLTTKNNVANNIFWHV